MFRKNVFIILFFLFSAVWLFSQDNLLKPVYPESSTGLIYLEGEDAVSTNFANQPVSNFGCSGFQAVQLNRNTGLQGGAAFFAEFVFYVEEPGEYEFWYGGTPPGPSDELSPSYASPFRFRIDEDEPVKVYREDIHVIEGYSPSYYWNKCIVVNLTEGSHRLRIEVTEKRGFDSRYYFYLDSLFFLNRAKVDEIEKIKPAVFPTVLDSDAIDNPFMSITDYQKYINLHPDEKDAYIELSLVFSLVGDYQGALKTLAKAMALDASDSYPIVLAAKNRLWKGDVRESLALYDRALSANPEDRALWAEAGKVAAWTAEYDKSIGFFTRGIERFPDDLNMRVNLALTYLWMARDADAEEAFSMAFKTASTDPEKLGELGWIEEANGYPEYARDVYLQSMELYPEYLEFYLLLQSSYLSSGDREAADDIGRRIESTFIPSVRLQNELAVYRKKLSLRDEVIASYLSRLKEEPGNLELRQELAQTFFWNGMSIEAIEQIKYVITTYSYRAAETWVRRSADVLRLIDQTAALVPFFENYNSTSSAALKALNSAAGILVKAEKAAAASEGKEQEDSAQAKAALREARQKFADAVAAARQIGTEMELVTDVADTYKKAVEDILVLEKEKDEAFTGVIGASGWSWAKSWQIDELTRIMTVEKALASYMLSRVLMTEGEYDRAAEVLMPIREEGIVIIETAEDAAAVEAAEASSGEIAAEVLNAYDYSLMNTDILYSLYQALLLGGRDEARSVLFEKERDRLTADYAHLIDVEEKLKLAENPIGNSPAGVYYDGLGSETGDVIKTLEDYKQTASEYYNTVDRLLKQLKAVEANELERANYYLESDTYLIRYELGNYYLDESMNVEASEQFRRVIAVDPWNISAAYKLGIVEQRYGNWSEAMKFYKKVYQQDPAYENSVYYYNQLARAHSDRTSTAFQLINTPSEIAFSGTLGWSTEFNSTVGLGIDYTLDQQRLYREPSNETKNTFQVHLVEASLPFSLGRTGIKVTPQVGMYAESVFYKEDAYFSDDDSVTAGEYLDSISTYIKYGAKAGWKWNFLTVDASWENAIEPDTFYVDRNIVRKNDIELNINTWFNFEEDLFGPLTTRTYGRLQLSNDNNVRGQVFQDVMFGFNLLSNPVIRLSPAVSFNYENSLPMQVSDYYAPRNVIEAKGGLRSAFTFPSSDWSRAFEAVLWCAGGGYWSGLGSDSALSSAKAEAGLGVTWVKNSNMYYLNLNGAGTFIDGENNYWEISVSLGSNLALPGLLSP